MKFRTLYSRLALTLFVLLSLVGLMLNQLIRESSNMYQQEVTQKLNSRLAFNISSDRALIRNQVIDRSATDALFQQLMVVNPSIELYLLDPQGKVLGYTAPEGKVKRTEVDLDPVRQFLDYPARFPVEGDDPRDLEGRKVFSAAKIEDENGLQGYLYIVLGGEKYDDIVALLRDSYILDSALLVLLVALVAALLCGLIVFSLLTKRLRILGNVMRRYSARSADSGDSIEYPYDRKKKDEIDELGQQFNQMAAKIDEQIHQLQRMDGMRREMVANVSHDLRTPLTTMRGYLETLLIKNDELSGDEKTQYLKTALLHSQRLGNLVEELFELARLDSCESVVYAEPFSMAELVQDVAQNFQLRAQQKSIELNASLQQRLPLIYGDIAMMQRVLENLLENGLRHTPEGGRIGIRVDVDSGNVVVKISDTGCGIPGEEVPRIFERFYQRDKIADNPGAGLGLSIVKRILELHGSVIRVKSELNHGTTFSFAMPVGNPS
ncbi:MAG: ATP-binding protein [Gammaproteobacteria bacterium]